MAKKAQLTEKISVSLSPEWKSRVAAVADHEQVNLSYSDLVRGFIEQILPGIELELGLLTLADLGLEEEEEEPEPLREDRSAGCFGGPPRAG